jgi:putative FmdB family regulatory protein
MPLYEFRCASCGHTFEVLVRRGEMPTNCPSCDASDPERLLSLFSVNSEATRQGALASGRKQNAKLQKDKMIADREEIEHHRH